MNVAGDSPRVAIVVDHPQRDLEGVVLVAQELTLRGAVVYLVPLYSFSEVFFLGVDVVLANYLRANNEKALAACIHVGIRVVVLDTEGGVIRDLDKFAEDILSRHDAANRYCCWGYKQARALGGKGREGWSVATGCPRFDLLSERWRESIPPVPKQYQGCILVNMSFPVLHPRFQSHEREVRDLVGVHGYEFEYVREWVEQLRIAFSAMLEATHALASSFPDRQVVLRPHPFEDIAAYVGEFADRSNVTVVQAGSVFRWLKACSVLVHHNCTTAIEAIQIGRDPLMVDWRETPLLDQHASRSVSLLMKNTADLIAAVATVLGGQDLDLPVELERARENVIHDWFRASDGLAYYRVADVVVAEANFASAISEESVLGLATRVASLSLSGGPTQTLKASLRWLLGEKPYNRLK